MSSLFKPQGEKPALFITADYELFLGSRSGTVDQCLVEPTDQLTRIAEAHRRRITFFVDVLYLLRLKDLSVREPLAERDCRIVLSQLGGLLQRGHDLQLHLHPQWLDAVFQTGQWVFPSYARYSLTQLSDEGPMDSLETLSGCIARSIRWLSEFCQSHVPGYEIRCFRAGGLCLQPFDRLSQPLQTAGIRIDSSVAPGLSMHDGIRDYDFRSTPKTDHWTFSDDPCVSTKEGPMIEMPVLTFEAGLITKGRAWWSRRRANGKARVMGDGESLRAPRRGLLRRAFPSTALLTYDYWDARTMRDVLIHKHQARWRIFTMLGHPKFLSSYGLDQLDQVLSWCDREGWA